MGAIMLTWIFVAANDIYAVRMLALPILVCGFMYATCVTDCIRGKIAYTELMQGTNHKRRTAIRRLVHKQKLEHMKQDLQMSKYYSAYLLNNLTYNGIEMDISQWTRCNIACYFLLLGFNEYHIHRITSVVSSGSQLLTLALVMNASEETTESDTELQKLINEIFEDEPTKLESFYNAIRTLLHYQNKQKPIDDFFMSISKVKELIDSMQYNDPELVYFLRSNIVKNSIHGSCLLAMNQATIRSWFPKDQEHEFNQFLSAVNTLRYQHCWLRSGPLTGNDAIWQWGDLSPRRRSIVVPVVFDRIQQEPKCGAQESPIEIELAIEEEMKGGEEEVDEQQEIAPEEIV
jgi:hypothetical protein